jgi:hypothetical protein
VLKDTIFIPSSADAGAWRQMRFACQHLRKPKAALSPLSLLGIVYDSFFISPSFITIVIYKDAIALFPPVSGG